MPLHKSKIKEMIIWLNGTFTSFKGCVSRTFGGTDTGFSVLGVLVGEGELAQVSADHIELDFDNVEGFAVVDSDVATNHVGHNYSISKVGLDGDWLISRESVLFCLFAFQVQSVISVLDFWHRWYYLLLAKRRLWRALKSSTTCSWVSSLSCSGVYPLKLYFCNPFSFFWTVDIWLLII